MLPGVGWLKQEYTIFDLTDLLLRYWPLLALLLISDNP